MIDERSRNGRSHEERHPGVSAIAAPPRPNPLAARALIFLVRNRVPVLKRLLEIALGGDINCKLPVTVLMPHPYGITIHGGAVVGENVTIMQQVTIGSRNEGDAAPIIEDGVLIGAGAKVIGEVRVGRDAKVGANAVVSKDVPAHSTVVGFNQIIFPQVGEARNNSGRHL